MKGFNKYYRLEKKINKLYAKKIKLYEQTRKNPTLKVMKELERKLIKIRKQIDGYLQEQQEIVRSNNTENI